MMKKRENMTIVRLIKVHVCFENIIQYLSVNNVQLAFYIDNSQLLDSPTACDSGTCDTSTNKSATTSITSATTTASGSGSSDCSKPFPTKGW